MTPAPAMSFQKFTIPGEPVGKGRPKFTARGGFARAYTPEKTRNYEAYVKVCAGTAGIRLVDRPVYMTIKAYFRLPKKKENLSPATKRPDIDNVIKIICDSLNGVAYKDDALVYRVDAQKLYSHNPRVEVIIS